MFEGFLRPMFVLNLRCQSVVEDNSLWAVFFRSESTNLTPMKSHGPDGRIGSAQVSTAIDS